MAVILDGKALAAKVRAQLKDEILQNSKFATKPPTMALILVGDNPGSSYYVRLKAKACKNTGLDGREIKLPETISEQELLNKINELNQDEQVDAILVQLPLPAHIDKNKVLSAIDPRKDVDCFHPYNVGLLHSGQARLAPCTPAGIMALLEEYGIELSGRRALVVGRSNIVGTPMAALLRQADCTVTVAHSKSGDLTALVKEADIVISAAGVAGLVTGNMLKSGAVVVDVGQNRGPDDQLVGDVDYQSASEVASYITPVPGGVGPLTIAFLLKNCVELAKQRF